MKYIWIGMLIVIDATWWIWSIADIVSTVKVVKNHKRYSNIAEFIKCIVEELDDSTSYCIALHISALFFVSLLVWVWYK
jgi:hypothetical protein